MRRFWIAPLVLVLSAPAWAQDNLKIGFVNRDRVLRDSAPAVRALKKLEKEFEKREADLRTMENQVRSLQEFLERNSLTLPDAERKLKEREFNDLSREYQRKQREWREDRSQRQNEELAAVLERTNQAIRDLGKAGKYDLILFEAVFHSPRIDLTEAVLKALAEPPAPK